MITMILDAGACPNLIREDALSTMWFGKVQPIRASTRAAGNTTFRVKGIVRLTVDIRGLNTCIFSCCTEVSNKNDSWNGANLQRNHEASGLISFTHPL